MKFGLIKWTALGKYKCKSITTDGIELSDYKSMRTLNADDCYEYIDVLEFSSIK